MAETIVNELVYSFLLPEVAKQEFRERGGIIFIIAACRNKCTLRMSDQQKIDERYCM
jgi:hypothetical protein